MKARKNVATFVILVLFIFVAGWAGAAEKTDWDVFSKNLVKSLKSDNQGVKLSAMQQVIAYAESVNVDDAIFDIVEVYRSHPALKVRQLALTTLYKTNNAWAMDFLKRNLEFEKSPVLKAQIYHILNENDPGNVYAKKMEKKGEVELATK